MPTGLMIFCYKYHECNNQPPPTASRWVPSSPTRFLVAHADGAIITYDKEAKTADVCLHLMDHVNHTPRTTLSSPSGYTHRRRLQDSFAVAFDQDIRTYRFGSIGGRQQTNPGQWKESPFDATQQNRRTTRVRFIQRCFTPTQSAAESNNLRL